MYLYDRFYMTLNGSLYPWVIADWETNVNMLRHKASGTGGFHSNGGCI